MAVLSYLLALSAVIDMLWLSYYPEFYYFPKKGDLVFTPERNL